MNLNEVCFQPGFFVFVFFVCVRVRRNVRLVAPFRRLEAQAPHPGLERVSAGLCEVSASWGESLGRPPSDRPVWLKRREQGFSGRQDLLPGWYPAALSRIVPGPGESPFSRLPANVLPWSPRPQMRNSSLKGRGRATGSAVRIWLIATEDTELF